MNRSEALSDRVAIAERDGETSPTPTEMERRFHPLTPTQQSPESTGYFRGAEKYLMPVITPEF